MYNNQIGTIEIISYRTTSQDEDYKYPVIGVLNGTSISHIAFRLKFSDRALFEKYVVGNANIKYSDNLTDSKTGAKMYEVYFSFWPLNEGTNLQSETSTLHDHFHDCEMSALGTPMTYNNKYLRYLNPQRREIASLIPVLNYLIRDTVTLPPTLMFHTTRFKNTLEALCSNYSPIDQAKIVNSILDIANVYSAKYKTWFAATVAQKNYSVSLCTSWQTSKELATDTQNALIDLLACKQQFKLLLRKAMFPNREISDNEFNDALEQFYTFGLPEVETIILPLVKNSCANKSNGLDLEPMLQYIQKVANAPDTYKYNLFDFNCATVILEILKSGVQTCASKELKAAFEVPWYAQWLCFPVSPSMVMRLAHKASVIKDLIPAEQIICHTEKSEYRCCLDTASMIRRNKNRAYITEQATILPQYYYAQIENMAEATDNKPSKTTRNIAS